jgi:hypothetical protein
MFTRIALASVAAAVLSVAAASPSFAAGEASYDYPQAVASTVTRAEVRQAAIAARQAGLVTQGELSVVAEVTMGSSQLTRAQVKAELAEARRLGLVGEGEHNVFPTPAQLEQIRLAGLKAAMPMVAAR